MGQDWGDLASAQEEYIREYAITTHRDEGSNLTGLQKKLLEISSTINSSDPVLVVRAFIEECLGPVQDNIRIFLNDTGGVQHLRWSNPEATKKSLQSQFEIAQKIALEEGANK